MGFPTAPPADDSDETRTDTVTRLLADFANGDETALAAVFPFVYAELREIAHRHRRKWSGDTTLGTTAIVNEAYLKLVAAPGLEARTRLHFLRVASRAMRQILSNYGRDMRASKRGGEASTVAFGSIEIDGLARTESSDSSSLADLGDALDRLETFDSRLARVVECRFFGGLSIDETAGALDVSPATVKRDWVLARAWLYREMNPSSE